MLRTPTLAAPVLAVLLVALLVAVGCTPPPAATPSATAEPEAASTITAVDESIAGVEEIEAPEETAQLVSLRVPSMHCQHGCWPKVQQALEQQADVLEVALGEQPLDRDFDPVVQVRVGEGFHTAGAVQALADAGFAGAVVEN